MNFAELIYQIGITLIPGIGVIHAKNLIAHCGSAEAVFKETKQSLRRIPGIGDRSIRNIADQKVLNRAEAEISFIEKNHIKPLYYLDAAYPKRLKLCEDGPIMLYQRGDLDFNRHHVIAFVGSRAATDYGKAFCQDFIADIRKFNPLIVSGLAYGIDIASHKAALKNNLPTLGVLGHGLDKIYPSLHKATAEKMVESGGGLITEFLSGTKPDRENFPKRNRIVAGMCDAVVVVQAAIKGGALITAEIANSYNRDVFAVPGRLNDTFSEGCNFLIKTNKAALITSPDDLNYILGWETETQEKAHAVQKQLFVELNSEESLLKKQMIQYKGRVELDKLCVDVNLPVSKVLPVLMTMELKGLVKSYPGRTFELQT